MDQQLTKDFFISYGRRESIHFAARMHRDLTLEGYTAWFDKVNIPHGDDYQARIDHGVASADNFIFIISPHAVRSFYCMLEVALAIDCGKRIIPVLHVAPSGEDWQHLPTQLGQDTKAENQKLNQRALDGLKRLQSIDWIYYREEPGPMETLIAWKEGYENFWKQHDDNNFLKTWSCPIQWNALDDANKAFQKILKVAGKQQGYVSAHTRYLLKALDWQKDNYATHALLSGKERAEADQWMQVAFAAPQLPPCSKTSLLCQFVTESRKNAENLLTDVFICHEAADVEIRDKVIRSLEWHGITSWVAERDAKKSSDVHEAIQQGIEGADTFICFLSSATLNSPACLHQLAHAVICHKRIIPLMISEVEQAKMPEALLELPIVDFTDNDTDADFRKDIIDILNILQLERQYFKDHKSILVSALKWNREDRKASYLWRGFQLDHALTWLQLNKDRVKQSPTNLQIEFIQQSEEDKGKQRTEVFISYSPKDGDFARKVNDSLQSAGKTTWFDQEFVAVAGNAETEIFNGISGADNVVLILSDDAFSSADWIREVDMSVEKNKRIAIIKYREWSPEFDVPESLLERPFIDFTGRSYGKAFNELIQALDIDREYVRTHTILEERATEWLENDRTNHYLLNRSANRIYLEWFGSAGLPLVTSHESELGEVDLLQQSPERVVLVEEQLKTSQKAPAPSMLQYEYVRESTAAIEAEDAKQIRIARTLKKRLRNAVIMGVIAVIVAVFAVFARAEAVRNQRLAKKNEALALAAQKIALERQDSLEIQQVRILKQKRDLEIEKEKSDSLLIVAILANDEARRSLAAMIVAQDSAQKNLLLALAAKKEADRNLVIAIENRAEAVRQKDIAERLRLAEHIKALLLLSEKLSLSEKDSARYYAQKAIALARSEKIPIAPFDLLSVLSKLHQAYFPTHAQWLTNKRSLVDFTTSLTSGWALSENGELWEVFNDGANPARLYQSDQLVGAVSFFFKDGSLYASNRYGQIWTFDIYGQELEVRQGFPITVRHDKTAIPAISPFKEGFLSVGYEGQLLGYSARGTGFQLGPTFDISDPISLFDALPSSGQMAVLTYAGHLSVLREDPEDFKQFLQQQVAWLEEPVTALRMHRDEIWLGFADGSLKRLSLADDSLFAAESLTQHKAAILNIDIQGAKVVTAARDGSVILRAYSDTLLTRHLSDYKVQHDLLTIGEVKVRFDESGQMLYVMDDRNLYRWIIDQDRLMNRLAINP